MIRDGDFNLAAKGPTFTEVPVPKPQGEGQDMRDVTGYTAVIPSARFT